MPPVDPVCPPILSFRRGRSERHDRPYFDRTVLCAGKSLRHPDGLLHVCGLHQVEAGELLLGLGERPVGGDSLTVADPSRGRGICRQERIAALDGFAEFVAVSAVFGHFRIGITVAPALFVIVNQKQKLHEYLSLSVYRRASLWKSTHAPGNFAPGFLRAGT